MLTTIAAIALLQVSGAAQAAATGDTCEVYLVDVAGRVGRATGV